MRIALRSSRTGTSGIDDTVAAYGCPVYFVVRSHA